ncbi:mediator complex subunit Med11 [Schizosaccharomyces japonicus yFS275]|uniref:Mediator of RNA polymerase II transcription subunit 11 n=1 Tax=Schizosaccharomyces japonicus (strain yFS275 / FY16936) TaxID=402676 RepID=B6JXT9_SCHJY|nr:mediator complex subunit Med11 [Schizosaccharomyces japonicus yFS275]EEB06357.1 mediator complex subunit Med11 [Schizosaccharomyces japonicus yFS275]
MEELFSPSPSPEIDETSELKTIAEIERRIPDILTSASACIEAIKEEKSIEKFQQHARDFFSTVEFVSTGLSRQVLQLEKVETPTTLLPPKKQQMNASLAAQTWEALQDMSHSG